MPPLEPYYSDDYVTIYHGSNDGFIEDLNFDLVVTSPPYNLNGDGNKSGGTYFKNLANGYASHDDAMPHEAYAAWQRGLLGRLWQKLPDDGAIFYNHKPRVGGPSVKLPFDLLPDEVNLRQIVIWDRGSGFNRQFTYFVPAHEWVLLLAKPAFRTTTRSIDDVWRIPPETNTEHPAPFPLKLAMTAIAATSAKVVLDPFMGSGTTLRAAKDLGRKAIGIELDERYCEIAAKRCAQEVLDFGAA
jgi:site-specific DNA-methyltransferase (adenine-specific)